MIISFQYQMVPWNIVKSDWFFLDRNTFTIPAAVKLPKSLKSEKTLKFETVLGNWSLDKAGVIYM